MTTPTPGGGGGGTKKTNLQYLKTTPEAVEGQGLWCSYTAYGNRKQHFFCINFLKVLYKVRHRPNLRSKSL